MDKDLIIPIREKKEGMRAQLRRWLLVEKLNNKLGIGIMLFVSLCIAYAVSMYGFKIGVVCLAAMVAIPMVYCVVAFPRFGIIVSLTMGYLIMWFYKMGVDFPLGTLMDGMEGLFILSVFIRQKEKKNWAVFKTPVTAWMLIWVGYNIVEVANPIAASRLAWVYTIRTVAVVMFMYFIYLYYITTKQYIKIIFKLWIGLALFGALYAFKQEHVGFFPFEQQFLDSDPSIGLLLFIGGVWRKFSIFSDPVSFAYNMVTASMLCIGLATGPVSGFKRFLLISFALFFLLVMLYSGTRGAFVLPPAGLALLAVLKYNKRMMLIVGVAGALIAVMIFMPSHNQTITRFQSAFRPSDDASFNLRKINQKRIQPFMQTHPLGGGLGAVGEWGKRFSPGTLLGDFQPDSGYVRVAVELGWLGLLLFCTLMFLILKTGIDNYYKIKDPELKSYCLAVTLVVFALNIGNYPQEALVQYPNNIYFYLVVALMTVTLRIDQKMQKENALQ